MTVGARLSAGVRVCVRVALGCVDALQSGGIVPIVEKVRVLIKYVWSPDMSHRPTAASRDWPRLRELQEVVCACVQYQVWTFFPLVDQKL